MKGVLSKPVDALRKLRFSRRVLPEPNGRLTRAELINTVIDLVNARKYLEIGVNTRAQPGYSRDLIHAAIVHGVDPNTETEADFHMTSDEFFAIRPREKYDVVFVDGLHRFEQAYKDIVNALGALTNSGVIIVHDTRPVSFDTQTRKQGTTNKWHGDVWRAIVFLRLTHPELAVITVDTDEGCTVVFRGAGEPLTGLFDDELFSWSSFCANYETLLNLVQEEDFVERFLEARSGSADSG